MAARATRRMATRLRAVAAALLAASGLAAPAAAQSGDETVFQITPYVWATGLGGSLTLDARRVEFEESFRDILSDLDGAFFLSAFARHDRVVFLGDVSWSSSSREGVVPVPVPLKASGRLRQTSVTLAAGYRVLEGSGPTVDLLGGLRHWRIEAKATVPDLGFSQTRRASFTDPIVGARLNAPIAPGWSSLVYADVGGFGVGSERSWQLLATLNYAVSRDIFLSVGYRHLEVDYRSSALRVDTRFSGPLIGASFRF